MIKEPPYNLKELRALSMKSTNAVAAHLSVKRQTIYNWEKGIVLIPLNQLRKIIHYYGFTWIDVDFDRIINESDIGKKEVSE